MLAGLFTRTSGARACVTGAMPTTQLQHEKRVYATTGDARLRPNQKPEGGYLNEISADPCRRTSDRRRRLAVLDRGFRPGRWLDQADRRQLQGRRLERGRQGQLGLKDGALMADKLDGKDPSYLVSKDSYKDFMIQAEFWADDAANSGILLRCDERAKIDAKICYEVNIFDKRPDPTYGTGAIVDVAKVDPMPKAGGKWNTYEITAKGSQLTVVLNGQKTVDVQDSKHAAGPFALQYGSGVIKFRKVYIKPL